MALSKTQTLAGFPDANSTGVPSGVTLTPSTGDLTITTPGTVIDARDIKGTVWILAPNVTIQNSRITATDWTGVWIKPGVTGTVIKDSEIQNIGSSVDGANGIVGSGTFLRNDISHIENGFNINGPSVIQDNYIHDMYAPNVRIGTVWGGPHYDGIEINGGRDIYVKHNTVINDNGQTSAVMIDNDAGAINNIQVDGNYLAGGGYTVYSDGSFNGSAITGVSFTNNYLGEGYWGYYYFKGNSPTLSGNVELGHTWPMPVSGSTSPTPTPTPTPDPTPTPTPTPTPGAVTGTNGNDNLVGTAGADTLKGLRGNDTYTVNHTGDKVVELAGQGTDKVFSSVTHTLAANVENLQLTGTGAINGTGNELNNTFLGNDSANVLKGGAGNDSLNGLGGKDTLYGGSGKDIFRFSSAYSADGDKVMDFAHNVDKLDFRKIDTNASKTGDQAFVFDGYTNGSKNGHLWAVEDTAAGVTDIYGKTGDFVFHIELKGTHLGLTTSDFYL
ncbi:calcium-binding protein [Microvirga flavescens]|uniref:calcium-binding protein n=1 Tax=Microvirga flavescens TaxID=2249811 RepID=UPI001300647D|nr:calcium-binding protein [Microvirga flavescens]